jgi:hypothetical protein
MPSKVKYKWKEVVQMPRKCMQPISVRKERERSRNKEDTDAWNRTLYRIHSLQTYLLTKCVTKFQALQIIV